MQADVTDPFVAKLKRFAPLSHDDAHALDRLAATRLRHHGSREDVASAGEAQHCLYLVLAGWICRYGMLPDGRRAIVAIYLPGDLCDHDAIALRTMAHMLGTLTEVTLAEIAPEAFEATLASRPPIARALRGAASVDLAIQREWTNSLARRDAKERCAHLFCELYHRLHGVGLAGADGCDMPLTQPDLADALGLTPVHVNRTLQEMRKENLIVFQQRRLTIPDLDALRRVALFDPAYLHLDANLRMSER